MVHRFNLLNFTSLKARSTNKMVLVHRFHTHVAVRQHSFPLSHIQHGYSLQKRSRWNSQKFEKKNLVRFKKKIGKSKLTVIFSFRFRYLYCVLMKLAFQIMLCLELEYQYDDNFHIPLYYLMIPLWILLSVTVADLLVILCTREYRNYHNFYRSHTDSWPNYD